jgi:hypothetical protein
MSNGGGAIPSAAEAPDPNDVIAKLNAAATQATANFLQVMTLPLSAPVAPVRRYLRVICSFDNITCGFDNDAISES